jgi:hypothetical protein
MQGADYDFAEPSAASQPWRAGLQLPSRLVAQKGGGVATKTTVPAESRKPGRRKTRPLSSRAVIGIANCALAGVTAVFITTRSVTVTLIAACAAVLLVGLTVIRS